MTNEPMVVIFNNQEIEETYLNESKKTVLNIIQTLSLFKAIKSINRFFNKYKDQTVDIGLITWKKSNVFFDNKGRLYKKPINTEYAVLMDGVSKITEIHSVYIFNNNSDKGFYVILGRISETDILNDLLSKRTTITDEIMDDCLIEYNFYMNEAEHLSKIAYIKNFKF